VLLATTKVDSIYNSSQLEDSWMVLILYV